MTEFEKRVKGQLTRIAHLGGFAESVEGVRDYEAALSVANTQEMVTRVMDDMVQSCPVFAPSAAVLRAAAYDAKERAERETEAIFKPTPFRAHCARCDDFGIAESINAADVQSVASYCDCQAGRERSRRHADTYSVERVNRARQTLLKIYKGDPLKAIAQGRKPDRFAEVYSGEF